MLKKSQKLYKKNKYYTRKRLSSYISKKSNHISNARKIYNIQNITPTKELALKTGCNYQHYNKLLKREKGRIIHLVQDQIKHRNRGD